MSTGKDKHIDAFFENQPKPREVEDYFFQKLSPEEMSSHYRRFVESFTKSNIPHLAAFRKLSTPEEQAEQYVFTLDLMDNRSTIHQNDLFDSLSGENQAKFLIATIKEIPSTIRKIDFVLSDRTPKNKRSNALIEIIAMKIEQNKSITPKNIIKDFLITTNHELQLNASQGYAITSESEDWFKDMTVDTILKQIKSNKIAALGLKSSASNNAVKKKSHTHD